MPPCVPETVTCQAGGGPGFWIPPDPPYAGASAASQLGSWESWLPAACPKIQPVRLCVPPQREVIFGWGAPAGPARPLLSRGRLTPPVIASPVLCPSQQPPCDKGAFPCWQMRMTRPREVEVLLQGPKAGSQGLGPRSPARTAVAHPFSRSPVHFAQESYSVPFSSVALPRYSM